MALFGKKQTVLEDGQMELVEHLAELRTRIFRILAYLVVGMVLTYSFLPQIMEVLKYPVEPVLKTLDAKLMMPQISAGFFLWMQVCFISGLVVAFPLVILELWGFVKPALTPEERRPVTFLAPFSFLLFLAGVATGYASLPSAFGWMAGFIADFKDVSLFQNLQDYILLTLKILLAFGISFELPVVLLFLGRVGIINAGMMTTYWRHAIVLIAVAAAVLTPSNDPLTMMMMAVPMAGLYLLSISLVRAFEPKTDGSRPMNFVTMFLVAMAPVLILSASGFWLWQTRHTAGTNKHLANLEQEVADDKRASPAPNASPAPISPQKEIESELATRVKVLEGKIERLEKLGVSTAAPKPKVAPPTVKKP